MEPIRFVCASQRPSEEFAAETMLGRMLERYKSYAPVDLSLIAGNSRGLPAVYNEVIEQEANQDQIIAFVHDDVCLLDFYWQDTLRRALTMYDVVGLVGNRRREAMQPSWSFRNVNGNVIWDDVGNLAGAMGFGQEFPCHIGYFGPAWQECKLLDGVFLAVRAEVLRRSGLRFDERFSFHFYDLDFCREAEARGLTMGVCSIAAIHGSPGGFNQSWHEGYHTYLQKWGD